MQLVKYQRVLSLKPSNKVYEVKFQAPVVQNQDNFIHWISHYPVQPTLFRMMLLARFLHKPTILIHLSSCYIRFMWLYQVFPTYFIFWIAAYPLDNAIHPLDNWGQIAKSNSFVALSCTGSCPRIEISGWPISRDYAC